MAANLTVNYGSFDEVTAALNGRDTKRLSANARLERIGPYTIALRLHSTDILTFTPDRVILRTGGYRTVTTKRYINGYGPVQLYQAAWNWYAVCHGKTGPGAHRLFDDGQAYTYSGKHLD